MTTLAPSYDPKTFEARLYAEWETSGVFEPRGDGLAYTILLPPPNVTGTLHMGHAFQHTLQDALIRYHRMRGYRTLWQMGTDHAGIATEMVVARNLARDGLTRDDLGRDKFIEKVWEWKGESGDTIERQMRRLGTSGDWTRKVFTMDDSASNAVIEAFVKLHEDGLIYRGQRLVNWDPVLKTAISDLEVVSEEEDGFLWSISYPLSDGSGSLVVATTRPETMLGDSAVMVHPEDERYSHLVGKTVTLPLTDRQIPIIADDYVDREFGTGVVKVTPAHDFNDYAVWKRHVDSGTFDALPKRGLINIFTEDAKIKSTYWDDFSFPRIEDAAVLADTAIFGKSVSETLPQRYHGLDRYAAREAIVADLQVQGLLVEIKPHKLQVPRGDRTGQVIEPFLTYQWFVKMDSLAKRGMELVENGSVNFVPPNWVNTYRHWMGNIQDWCISRQLWWGHRIPAWFDSAGDFYVARTVEEAQAKFNKKFQKKIDDRLAQLEEAKTDGYSLIDADSLNREIKSFKEKLEEGIAQDSDVLETWFSSGIWPISTMGWPDADAMRERGFDNYVPSTVLVTGFDIIFFWVARMIVMTDRLAQQVPFKDVYITGLVRDKEGQKMSKSKGNILDPLDIIDGITLDDLIAKRTIGLMQPKMAHKIEKATRKEFPDGIQAFGADPLRFTMAALAGPGRDIKFDLNRAEGYKNFCNKLWNATRFVLMNTEGFSAPQGDLLRGAGEASAPSASTDAEKWILARLANVSAEVETHFAAYRFDLLTQALYEFAWNDFCDWFVELAKPALNDGDAAAADSTRHTLLYVLESLLRLLHPLIPFVTEELWRSVAPRLSIDDDTISLRTYPQTSEFTANDFTQAEADVEWLKQMVSALRRVRSELGVSPTKVVSLLLQGGTDNDRARTERFASQLKFLNRIDAIAWLDDAPPPAATAVVGDLKLFVPLAGLVDLDAERTRMDKELKRVESELAKSRGKLASETFVQNAPAAVVEQERQRLIDWTAQREALASQRARL